MKRVVLFMMLLLMVGWAHAETDLASAIQQKTENFVANLAENKEVNAMKRGCDQLVLASKNDGAFAMITDYNNRYQWMLAGGYFYETQVDTTGPTFGLNLYYTPGEDAGKIFPGNLGVWYSYPKTDLAALRALYVAALNASSNYSMTIVEEKTTTRYANTPGYDVTVRMKSGYRYIIWKTHIVIVDGFGYFIFYLTTETDYNHALSQSYYNLILAVLSISPSQTQVSPPWEYKPGEFQLSQNYPNPFNNATAFEFSLDEPQNVTFEVYSVTGALVDVLFDREFSAGPHTVNLQANALPSGPYFCVMKGRNQRAVKKILLIK